MKHFIHSLAVSAAAIILLPTAAQALPIRLDTTPYISPDTSIPGNPSNQGQGTVRDWLQDLVNAYNAANNPDLPDVDSQPAFEYEEKQKDVRSLEISVAGYTYLTVHWGGKKKTDHTQAWYLGGTLDTFELVSPTGKGLSGYRLWNEVPRVPDGGSTLALLGLGLLGLLAWSRRTQNSVG